MTEPVRDFSTSLEPKRFKINDDEFEAVSMMPSLGPNGAYVWTDKFSEAAGDTEKQEVLYREFFGTFIREPGRTRLLERLESTTEPVGFGQQMDIVDWLMGEYGLRPPRPPGDSSSGSASRDGGTSSGDVASSQESTLVPFPSSSSSTSSTR